MIGLKTLVTLYGTLISVGGFVGDKIFLDQDIAAPFLKVLKIVDFS